MKTKLFKATIIYDDKEASLIVHGKRKAKTKRDLINFYITIGHVKHKKDIKVYLEEVIYKDGNYIKK